MDNELITAAQMKAIFNGVDFRHETASVECFSDAYIKAHIRNILSYALDEATSWNNTLCYDLMQKDHLYFKYERNDPRIKEALMLIGLKLESLGYSCKSFIGKRGYNFVAEIEVSW